jgi:hypothetical protein
MLQKTFAEDLTRTWESHQRSIIELYQKAMQLNEELESRLNSPVDSDAERQSLRELLHLAFTVHQYIYQMQKLSGAWTYTAQRIEKLLVTGTKQVTF